MSSAQKLSTESREFLRGVDSPTVANAIETLNVRDRTVGFLPGDIQCQFPELGVMVGTALTVEMSNRPGPVADKAGWWEMWERLEQTERPSVLVVKDVSGEPQRVAYAGEIMSRLATRLGSVGMVTDGALRDVAEAQAMGFHYFMKYPVVSHANFYITRVGEPVDMGGETIATGDLLHGDRNGVVVIPWECLPDLPAAVDKIRVTERADMDLIGSQDFTLDRYKIHRNYGK
jgi:4-hydroxy-4-methyl-2-oxoglutarate aldolase